MPLIQSVSYMTRDTAESDLLLPVGSRYQLFKEIAEHPDFPQIVSSGNCDSAIATRLIEQASCSFEVGSGWLQRGQSLMVGMVESGAVLHAESFELPLKGSLCRVQRLATSIIVAVTTVWSIRWLFKLRM